jgi:hypothetical protein
MPHMPWSKVLEAHWEAIAAADFFMVEPWTGLGLVRYLVFFVIDLSTRRVEIAGIAPVPNGLWSTITWSGATKAWATDQSREFKDSPRGPSSGRNGWERP